MKLSNRGKLTILLIMGMAMLLALLGIIETINPTIELQYVGWF